MNYARMIFTVPSNPILMIFDGVVIFSVVRSSRMALTLDFISGSISLKLEGIGFPERLAEVLTIGFRSPRINFKQIGPFVILIPPVPSEASFEGVIPLVVG